MNDPNGFPPGTAGLYFTPPPLHLGVSFEAVLANPPFLDKETAVSGDVFDDDENIAFPIWRQTEYDAAVSFASAADLRGFVAEMWARTVLDRNGVVFQRFIDNGLEAYLRIKGDKAALLLFPRERQPLVDDMYRWIEMLDLRVSQRPALDYAPDGYAPDGTEAPVFFWCTWNRKGGQ